MEQWQPKQSEVILNKHWKLMTLTPLSFLLTLQDIQPSQKLLWNPEGHYEKKGVEITVVVYKIL